MMNSQDTTHQNDETASNCGTSTSSAISSNFEEEHPRQETENTCTAVKISEENIAQVAKNKILKDRRKLDDLARDESVKQVSELALANEKIAATEKWKKQIEYRDFLLQQIEDKKKNKEARNLEARNFSEVRGNAYAYSEERMTSEGMKNLKLTKQQEMKEGLDECIRIKNASKLEEKEKEFEENRARLEFVKKQEENELMAYKEQERKFGIEEEMREETARHWRMNEEIEDDSEFPEEDFIDSHT